MREIDFRSRHMVKIVRENRHADVCNDLDDLAVAEPGETNFVHVLVALVAAILDDSPSEGQGGVRLII